MTIHGQGANLMAASATPSSTSMATTVADYNQAVLAMAKYANTILGTNLSVSGIDTADYAAFIEATGQMNTAASAWVEEVQPSLAALTGSVSSENAIINLYLTQALTAAQSLQNDPSNPALLQALNQALVNASQNILALQSLVQSTSDLVSQNSTFIPTASASLISIGTALTGALQQEKADVASVQSSIAQMQSTIASLESPPPSPNEFYNAAIFAIGFIMIFAGAAPGGITLCVEGIVGASIDIDTPPVSGALLSQLQAQVASLQNQLSEDNGIVAAVIATQNVALSLTQALNNITGSSSPLQQIQEFIEGNIQALQDVKNSIAQAQKDEGDWSDVVAQLNAASQEWQALQQADLPSGLTITTGPTQIITPSVTST